MVQNVYFAYSEFWYFQIKIVIEVKFELYYPILFLYISLYSCTTKYSKRLKVAHWNESHLYAISVFKYFF